MTSQIDIRWKQRFENLQRAHKLLQNAIIEVKKTPNNDTIRMGLIQSFEVAFELSWKTLKDYLVANGIDVQLSRETIRLSFANGIITDGQIWIDMLEDRNLLSHVYDLQKAVEAINHISEKYEHHIDKLCQFFKKKSE